MGTFFRAIAISTELLVLTVGVYVLLAVVKLALLTLAYTVNTATLSSLRRSSSAVWHSSFLFPT
jgi:hypothetical protein